MDVALMIQIRINNNFPPMICYKKYCKRNTFPKIAMSFESMRIHCTVASKCTVVAQNAI